MQHNFGPPDFLPGQAACPKCLSPVLPEEAHADCPVCFTRHHRRCVHEGVACGNRGCDYAFLFEEDGPPEFAEYAGPERRGPADRRSREAGAPDGVERRFGPRRRADF